MTAANPPGVVATMTAGIHAQTRKSNEKPSMYDSDVDFSVESEFRKISMKTKPAAGRSDTAATKTSHWYCDLGMSS
jgi:hypothetical protein